MSGEDPSHHCIYVHNESWTILVMLYVWCHKSTASLFHFHDHKYPLSLSHQKPEVSLIMCILLLQSKL